MDPENELKKRESLESEHSDCKETNNPKKLPFSLRGLCLAFIFLWVSSIALVVILFGSPASPGEFGDMFGAVNALFSGLALAGAIYAVLLQGRELELQRYEMSKSWRELREQNQLIAAQLKTNQDIATAELRRVRAQSRPRIEWRCSSTYENFRKYTFINYGGIMSELRTKCNGSIDITVHPNSAVPRGGEFNVIIPTDNESPKAEIHFDVNYTSQIGEFGQLHFITKGGSLTTVSSGPAEPLGADKERG